MKGTTGYALMVAIAFAFLSMSMRASRADGILETTKVNPAGHGGGCHVNTRSVATGTASHEPAEYAVYSVMGALVGLALSWRRLVAAHACRITIS